MTVFRNRKTAERSGAENMHRYLFEFRFVRFGYGYILRAARGTLSLKAHASARYLTQQGQAYENRRKTPPTYKDFPRQCFYLPA